MPSTGKGVTVSNNDEDFIDDSEPPLVFINTVCSKAIVKLK